jgi:hypothetical protein
VSTAKHRKDGPYARHPLPCPALPCPALPCPVSYPQWHRICRPPNRWPSRNLAHSQ